MVCVYVFSLILCKQDKLNIDIMKAKIFDLIFDAEKKLAIFSFSLLKIGLTRLESNLCLQRLILGLA